MIDYKRLDLQVETGTMEKVVKSGGEISLLVTSLQLSVPVKKGPPGGEPLASYATYFIFRGFIY